MEATEILQRIFNADCDPRDLDHRQLRKSFVELLEQHRKLQAEKKEIEQERFELDYRVNLLEEDMFELEELQCELKRKLKDEQKAKDAANRRAVDANEQMEATERLLDHRNRLIEAAGLVLYADVSRAEELKDKVVSSIPECILSKDTHQGLSRLEGVSLDEKIRLVLDKSSSLEEKVSSLTDQLSQLKVSESSKLAEDGISSRLLSAERASLANQPSLTSASRELSDLRMRSDRQNEEIECLKAERTRLEKALSRQKELVGRLEQSEENLAEERRRLKKELREATSTIDALSNANNILEVRIEKARDLRQKDRTTPKSLTFQKP